MGEVDRLERAVERVRRVGFRTACAERTSSLSAGVCRLVLILGVLP